MLLLIFCGAYDEIALFTSLQLRSNTNNSGWEVFSTILCIAMVVASLSLIFLIGYLCYKY